MVLQEGAVSNSQILGWRVGTRHCTPLKICSQMVGVKQRREAMTRSIDIRSGRD